MLAAEVTSCTVETELYVSDTDSKVVDAGSRMAATVEHVESGDERHTTRHTTRRQERLGKWQRQLLLEAAEPARLAEGRVPWSALVRRHAPDTTENAAHRKIASSLADALTRLELADLVRVTPPHSPEQKRRAIRYFELTARGLRRADELHAHDGVTRATAARRQRKKQWTDSRVQALADEANADRTRAEAALLTVSFPMFASLMKRYGYPPVLGGDDDVDEAAKRFLLLAYSRMAQKMVPVADTWSQHGPALAAIHEGMAAAALKAAEWLRRHGLLNDNALDEDPE